MFLYPQKPLALQSFWGYKNLMETPTNFTFDPAKDRQNKALHRMSLKEVERFEFATALVELDTRENYGEDRELALGVIGVRLHALVFTMRGTTCHAISLRKATKTEIQYYVDNS
jgi:uncharacterized DUF497 family protein